MASIIPASYGLISPSSSVQRKHHQKLASEMLASIGISGISNGQQSAATSAIKAT